MLILHDPECLLHETIELLGAKAIPALESPARLRSILAALETSSHTIQTINYSPSTDTDKEDLFKTVSETHDGGYLQHLQTAFSDWRAKDIVEEDGTILPECWRFPTSIKDYNNKPQPPKDIYARTGYYSFDMSSGITASTWNSTIASANLAHRAVHTLFPSPTNSKTTSTTTPSPSTPTTILALTRPPGHHCDGQRAGGYCYINNAAVAISTYQSLHPASTLHTPRIAILDLDFHHGNGTQELYYSSPSVLYISIHGQDEFPYYTGHASETGIDAGRGCNLNLPLPTGSGIAEYMEKLDIAMERLTQFDPGFVVVSLGFDTFELDPLGAFGIATGDYEGIARRVVGGLRAAAEGRETKSLVLLEGGYVIEKLGENMLSWLRGWEDGD